MTIRVAQMWRYPVKGLGGEEIRQTPIRKSGVPFDRRFALSHDRVPIGPFGTWTTYEAFLALDGFPTLAGYSARVDETGTTAQLEVSAPDGESLSIPLEADESIAQQSESDAALIDSWFRTRSHTARLIGAGTGLWDLADSPISLVNLATVQRVAESLGLDTLDPRRFRANLLLEGLESWGEFDLIGKTLRIGDTLLEVIRPIERCRAITVDPDRPSNDINVLAALAANFGHAFCGLYARVVRDGNIAQGDVIEVTSARVLAADTAGSNEGRAATPRVARVSRIERTADDVVSLSIDDPTGRLSTALPGQHLRIHDVDMPSPGWRKYTLSRTGAEPRISVRFESAGRMSSRLHDTELGDEVLITGPFGELIPDETELAPLVVVTAGIGVTPALAIAESLNRTPRAVTFVHVARTLRSVAHLDELTDACSRADAQFTLFLTGEKPSAHRHGRPDTQTLSELISHPEESVFVLCGPAAFDRGIRESLATLGVSRDRIRSDPFYSPRNVDFAWREPPTPGPHRVVFSDARQTESTWEGSGTLLDLADSVDVSIRSSCRAGVCGSCIVRTHGETAYVIDPLGEAPDGWTFACCAVPVADLEVEL